MVRKNLAGFHHTFIFALISSLLISVADATEPLAKAVDSVAVTVSNMDGSIAFYRDILNFEVISDNEVSGDNYEHLYGIFGARIRIVTLKLGDEKIQLEQFIAPQGRPIPVDSKSNDRWFQHIAIIVSDIAGAYARLEKYHVAHASTSPQLLPQWNPNAGGITAYYFRDPDGHNLEILHFPTGKGDAKWHRNSDKLFLGIDHSAIVVADTEASLKFYRDTLGLHIAGTSENYGIEQEHLNNVFGARLRITSLRAASGPGVEFLEYIAPTTGRPMPIDTQMNDVWSWHIDMRGDAEDAEKALRANHYAHVSPGPVKINEKEMKLLVRDPDGHAVLLKQ